MALSYGDQDDALNDASSSTSTVVPVPTVAAGTFMVAHITTAIASAGLTAPAGWTALDDPREDGNLTTAVYTRYATGSEPADYTWTHGATRSAGRILAYPGAHATAALADWSVVGTTTSLTSIVTGAVDVPADGWLLVLPADRRNAPSVAQAWSTDVGTDELRGEVSGATGSNFQSSSAGIDSGGPAAGTGVTRTVTATQTWGQAAVWVLAIAAEPPPPEMPDVVAPEIPVFRPGVPVGTLPDVFNALIRDPFAALLAPPIFRARRTGALAVTEADAAYVPWDQVDEDTYSGWASGTPSRWTVPAGWSGWWSVTAAVSLSGTGASNLVLIPTCAVNGTSQIEVNSGAGWEGMEVFVPVGVASVPKYVTSHWRVYAAAGDRVEIGLWYSNESSITAVETTPGRECRVELVWDGV